jgi:peroxiredoxin
MISSPDYKTINSIIEALKLFDNTTNENLSNCFTKTSEIVYDYQAKCISDDTLITFIMKNERLISFLNAEGKARIPIDLYILLYAHDNFRLHIGEFQSYKSVLGKIVNSSLYNDVKNIYSDLEFFSLVYYLGISDVEWQEFASEFDGKDWHEIHLFQSLLPYGNLTIDDLCNWITKVSKEQANDGALFTVGESIIKFVIQFHDVTNIEINIKRFATEQYLSSFFPAILTGLKTRQVQPYGFYYSLLRDEINSSTSYNILFAFGRICNENETDRSEYFSIINTHYNNGVLDLKGYLALCTSFNFYNDVIYDIISLNLVDLTNKNFAIVLIRYLYNAPGNIDVDWLTPTLLALFTMDEAKIIGDLDSLLIKISENNIDLALTMLENRLSFLGRNNMLENAIVKITHSHQYSFQTKFIAWLNSDNARLHVAIGHLSMIHSLDRKLFYIPKEVYDNLSFSEKLFIAYKSVGYIYSKETLQEIFISLIKSISVDNDAFGKRVSYLLTHLTQQTSKLSSFLIGGCG